jgi:DoxX-like family
MNSRLKIAISALRWTLGLVVLWQSYQFAFSPSVTRYFARTSLPLRLRPALAGSEIIAALLFLVPAASLVGGYLLLLVFAVAACVHLLHGEYDVGGLIVYVMAVIVCMMQPHKQGIEVSHDR